MKTYKPSLPAPKVRDFNRVTSTRTDEQKKKIKQEEKDRPSQPKSRAF